MQKTYRETMNFLQVATKYVNDNPSTKLSYAINKMIHRFKGPVDDYNEELKDINVKYASIDAAGNILIGPNGTYYFTRENNLLLNADFRNLRGKAISFEPYYATELPEKLDDFYAIAFTDFVINDAKP